MINTLDAILDQRPEAINGIRVDVAHHIDIVRVKDSFVAVAHIAKGIVDSVFISVDLRTLLYFVFDDGKNSLALGVGNCSGFDGSVASICNSNDRGLVCCSASTLALAPTAKVRFVNLDFAIHRVKVFIKHHADLFAHSPSRLVGNARLALDLLGGNPAAGLSHKIDGVEPGHERGSRLVKDRSSSG